MEGTSDTPPSSEGQAAIGGPPHFRRRPRPSASGILAPLASALGQCLCIVWPALYPSGASSARPTRQGLSAFVGAARPGSLIPGDGEPRHRDDGLADLLQARVDQDAVFVDTVVCCRLALSDGKRRAILDDDRPRPRQLDPLDALRQHRRRRLRRVRAERRRRAPGRRARGCAAPGCTPSSRRSPKICARAAALQRGVGAALPADDLRAHPCARAAQPARLRPHRMGQLDATDTACAAARVLSSCSARRSSPPSSPAPSSRRSSSPARRGCPSPSRRFFDAYRQAYTAAALTTLGLAAHELTALQDADGERVPRARPGARPPLLIRILGDVRSACRTRTRATSPSCTACSSRPPSSSSPASTPPRSARNSARNSAQFSDGCHPPQVPPARRQPRRPLVGLLLSAPFLVVSTAFLTMPEEAVPRSA